MIPNLDVFNNPLVFFNTIRLVIAKFNKVHALNYVFKKTHDMHIEC